MSLKRNYAEITRSAKRIKVEPRNYFAMIGRDLVKGISAYLPIKDLAHLKLASKGMNEGTVKLPENVQVTMLNFEEACSKPGVHTIQFKRENADFEYFINDVALGIKKEYLLVEDLLIDSCGKELNRFSIARLFPRLKSLKLIRCKGDVELYAPEMKVLEKLEIYSSKAIYLHMDRDLKETRLCSTHKNGISITHIGNIQYVAKKVVVDEEISGPYKDFVLDRKLL